MIANRSAAIGPVVPTLVYRDVGRAIEWLCQTFMFEEKFQYGPEDHPAGALLRAGNGSVMLTVARTGQSPEWGDTGEFRPPRPNEVTHTITVQVENVDEHYACAEEHGAKILSSPVTYPFGERQYAVEDLEGHRWTFTQSVVDVPPSAWGGREKNNRSGED